MLELLAEFAAQRHATCGQHVVPSDGQASMRCAPRKHGVVGLPQHLTQVVHAGHALAGRNPEQEAVRQNIARGAQRGGDAAGPAAASRLIPGPVPRPPGAPGRDGRRAGIADVGDAPARLQAAHHLDWPPPVRCAGARRSGLVDPEVAQQATADARVLHATASTSDSTHGAQAQVGEAADRRGHEVERPLGYRWLPTTRCAAWSSKLTSRSRRKSRGDEENNAPRLLPAKARVWRWWSAIIGSRETPVRARRRGRPSCATPKARWCSSKCASAPMASTAARRPRSRSKQRRCILGAKFYLHGS